MREELTREQTLDMLRKNVASTQSWAWVFPTLFVGCLILADIATFAGDLKGGIIFIGGSIVFGFRFLLHRQNKLILKVSEPAPGAGGDVAIATQTP